MWLSELENEKHSDSRFREVEDLLGIPTHDAVCDRVILSVCGLGGQKENKVLEDHIVPLN